MTTVVVRSPIDEDTSEKCHPQSITVTKLLSRPQTAVPTISSPISGNQKTLSSIEVIGQDAFKDDIDIKKRVKSAVNGHYVNRPNKQQQSTEGPRSSSGGLHRIRSATSHVNLKDCTNDVPRMKEVILQKSFSSPNFSQYPDVSFPVSLSSRETLSSSRSIVRKILRESNRKSLSIRSASVVLISRPKSSASLSSTFRQARPRTAHARVSQEFQQRESEVVKDNDGKANLAHSDDAKETAITTREVLKLSNTNVSEIANVAEGSGKAQTEKPTKADAKEKSAPRIELTDAPNLLDKSDDDTKPKIPDNDKVHIPCSVNVTNNIDSLARQKQTDKLPKLNETSLHDKLLNVIPVFEERTYGSCDSPVSRHSSPRKVTSPERELSPVCCSSPQPRHAPSYLPNPTTWSTSNALIPHIGTKDIGHLPSNVQLNIPETIKYTSVAPNSPSSGLSLSSSKIYKMAKVELYEKNTVKQGQLSILEEIKKQNTLLEDRNSESHLEESQSNMPKPGHLGEVGNETKHEAIGFSEKGNICGSPGYKLISEQLRGTNSFGRPKSLTTKRSSLHGTRDEQGDHGFPKKSDQDKKHIRPLSDYVRKSSLDNLRVTGGACAYKSGEDAVSNAAGNIATQAGIVSKMSVQGTPTKGDTSLDNASNISDGVNLQSKVHVSLSYLKEKNRVNSNTVAFRYRLDGYLDQNSNVRNSSSNDNGTQVLSGNTDDKNPDRLKDGCIVNANHQKSASSDQAKSALSDISHSQANHEMDVCNDSRTENTKSEKPENDTESMSHNSASSTPTAAFPGSELLYPNDGVHRSHGDELSASDMPGYERERQKLRDLEIGNRRPASRNKRALSVVDKVSFDRERDDLRALNNSLPAKTPVLRNPVQRNSLVRGEPMIANRGHGPNSNRESDELIAMGTNWSPANNNNNTNNNNSSNGAGGGSSTGPTRSSSNTTGSNKSIPLNNNNIGNSNGIPQRKPVSVSLSTSARLGHCNGTTTGGGAKNTNRDTAKEVEAKYSDPLIGAPASFQQRLMDLASLEAETIRWERTKRVKKKAKDRDS